MTKFYNWSVYNIFKGGEKLVVFLDVLILENFIVNLFLLNLTSKVVRTKVKLINAIISSLFGTTMAVLGLIARYSFLYNLPSKLIIAIIMILIIYKKKTSYF